MPLYPAGMVLAASYTRSDVVGTFGGFTSTDCTDGGTLPTPCVSGVMGAGGEEYRAVLRAAEERFHTIFDQAFQFTLLLTPAGQVVEFVRKSVNLDDMVAKRGVIITVCNMALGGFAGMAAEGETSLVSGGNPEWSVTDEPAEAPVMSTFQSICAVRAAAACSACRSIRDPSAPA